MDHTALGIVVALQEAGGNVDKAIVAAWIYNSCDPPALIQALKTALVNTNSCYGTLVAEVIHALPNYFAAGIVATLEDADGNVDKALVASWIVNFCDPPALVRAFPTVLVNKKPRCVKLLQEVIQALPGFQNEHIVLHHTLERPCTEMPVAKRARMGF
jgi:hypothetical protein